MYTPFYTGFNLQYGPYVHISYPNDHDISVWFGCTMCYGLKSIQQYGLPLQVIQRRFNGVERFNRNMSDYQKGFGDPGQEYWLGMIFASSKSRL